MGHTRERTERELPPSAQFEVGRRDRQRPLNVCAVTRRRFPVGASAGGRGSSGLRGRRGVRGRAMAGRTGACAQAGDLPTGPYQTCFHTEGQRQTQAAGHLNLAGSSLHDSSDAGAGADLRSRPSTGTLRLPSRHRYELRLVAQGRGDRRRSRARRHLCDPKQSPRERLPRRRHRPRLQGPQPPSPSVASAPSGPAGEVLSQPTGFSPRTERK